MDDSLPVSVNETLDELIDVVLGFGLSYSSASFHHLVEGMVAAEFQDDVDIFAVFENVIEKEDVFVFEGFMDFDLCD